MVFGCLHIAIHILTGATQKATLALIRERVPTSPIPMGVTVVYVTVQQGTLAIDVKQGFSWELQASQARSLQGKRWHGGVLYRS